jgi:NDP-sugar pyrophosphorylase family protein
MFEYGVFPNLLKNQELFYAYIWRGYWRDIGTSASYLQANLDVMNGEVNLLQPELGKRGEKVDATAEIDAHSVVDESCTVKAGAQIVNSFISRNCYIGEKARIENSVIRGGSRIETGATVRHSVIGKSCHIGRSVIADNTVLGDKTVLTDYSQC